MRTMESMPVPAASGTTMLTVRVGYSCAAAGEAWSAIARAPAKAALRSHENVMLETSLRHRTGGSYPVIPALVAGIRLSACSVACVVWRTKLASRPDNHEGGERSPMPKRSIAECADDPRRSLDICLHRGLIEAHVWIVVRAVPPLLHLHEEPR